MGVYTPFVGYRALSQSKYQDKRNEEDIKSLASINRLISIITNPDLTELIIGEYGFLYNPRGLGLEKWFAGLFEDSDADNREVLEGVLNKQSGNFTIVVPNLHHITNGNINNIKPLRAIVDKSIPVISADGFMTITERFFAKSSDIRDTSYSDWIREIKKMYMDDEKILDKSLKGRLYRKQRGLKKG